MPHTNKLINYLLIFSIFLYFLSFIIHPITAVTQDLGRHLKVGEIILKTGSVPKTNLLTYTYTDFPFINHHWLSEAVFFVTFQVGNFGLLLFCKILLMLGTFGLIFWLALKKSSLLTASLFSFIFLAVFQERTELRPEVLSFLFFATYLFIINGSLSRRTLRERPTQNAPGKIGLLSLLWLLPLIQVFWVNSHIYFFVGPILYLFFVIHLLITQKFKLSKTVIAVGVLIILANFINPNGINGAVYPLKVFENYGYQIVENKTPFFLEQYFGITNRTILFFKISLGLLIVSFIVNFKKINCFIRYSTVPYFNLLTSIFLSFMAIKAVRNFPLFALGTLPIVCQNYQLLFEKLTKKCLSKKNNIFDIFKIILIFVYLWQSSIFITNGWCKSRNSNKCFGWGIVDGPQKAGDFVVDNKISGPVFNNFDAGSFLEYRIWPEKAFIDGRPEAFPANFFSRVYIPMQEKPEVWEKKAEEYDFNYIFFSHTDQTPWGQVFLKNISQNKKWTMVYLNDRVVIYLKNNEKNQEIIDKFELTPKNAVLKTFPEGKDYLYFLRLARFFDLIGWQEASQLSFQKSQVLK